MDRSALIRVPYFGDYMKTFSQAIASTIPLDDEPFGGAQDSSVRASLKAVNFTRQQLALLESVFPECFATGETTDAQLRHNAGQRSVLHFIRTRTA